MSNSGELYSHSRLAAFEKCPQKFQYRYLWKLPAESESIEGFVGKRVHEVLERLYKVARGGRAPSLPKVLARYRQLFQDAHDPQHVRIVREGTPLQHYVELGEHCLANYYHDHYPFDRDETLALEEHLTFDIDDEDDGDADGAATPPARRYRIQGFVDRIARARDGAIEIQDYKTSARVPSRSDIDADRQLALYQLGIGARYGADRPVRLVWHYLRQGRTLVSTRTPEQLARLAGDTRALIDRIRSESVFAPQPSALCRWCEYRLGCPASSERPADRAPYAPPAPSSAPRSPSAAGGASVRSHGTPGRTHPHVGGQLHLFDRL